MRLIGKLGSDESGATAVEYALIIAMIVLAMIVGLGQFAGTTTTMWNNVSDKVTGA